MSNAQNIQVRFKNSQKTAFSKIVFGHIRYVTNKKQTIKRERGKQNEKETENIIIMGRRNGSPHNAKT